MVRVSAFEMYHNGLQYPSNMVKSSTITNSKKALISHLKGPNVIGLGFDVMELILHMGRGGTKFL